MGKMSRFSWMVAPKGFIRLIGAEYDILKNAGSFVLAKFYVSSVFILLIFSISIFSIKYAINLLFHVTLVELGMSFFFASLFVFIYIFLLNTFTKRNIETDNKYIRVSNVVRISFVVFMAFIISKPIEIFLFSRKLEPETEIYKAIILKAHNGVIDRLFEKDLSSLQNKKERYANYATNNSDHYSAELESIDSNIKSINVEKAKLSDLALIRVNKSSFFIFQVKQVTNKHPFASLVTLVIIFLFLTPGYLIFSISKDDEYYKMKRAYEDGMINKTYRAFSEQYSLIFENTIRESKTFFTVYADPPFNTVRKPDFQYKSKDDFLNKYNEKA